MKQRMIGFLLLFCLLMSGCGQRTGPYYWSQDIAGLRELLHSPAQETAAPAEEEPPQEITQIRAVWIPVMQYAEWMTGKTEAEFRDQVRAAFRACAALGLNCVFLHVRAYGDAYYDSDLFPHGSYLTGSYDPLAIMAAEAHQAGLEAHAWINPLRLKTPENMAQIPDTYLLRQWYDDPEKNGTYMKPSGSNLWLDPAYPEVRQLIADGAAEILAHYEVDGIHIDDYFYPTQDPAFDAAAFAESGAADLAQWRRDNCNALVKELYDTAKSYGKCFSISPQGDPETNYEQLYADVALWSREPGYCDWIIPQLYYGFENEHCPFQEMLAQWTEAAQSAKLVIGLAPYKIGQEDSWAGTGRTEWQTHGDVLSREAALALEKTDGISLYAYASLFYPSAQTAPAVSEERQRIGTLLQ